MAKISAFAAPLYEACAKKDESRPVLECVHFEGGYALASDGHIAVRSALRHHTGVKSPEMLEGKAIHWMVFKELMKSEFITAEADGVRTEGGVLFPYSVHSGHGPNYNAFLPVRGCFRASPVGYIGLKPELLMRAAKCLIDFEFNKSAVRIEFNGRTRVMHVSTLDEAIDQTVIVMPYDVPASANSVYDDPMFD